MSARKIGGHAPLILTRWYPDRPPLPYNLVLMQRPYAMLLEEGGHAALPQECIARIEDRLKWAEEVCRGAWVGEKSTVPPVKKLPYTPRIKDYQLLLNLLTLSAIASLSWFRVSRAS